MRFNELDLSPEILKAIGKLGFEEPTPIQAEVIPRLLQNRGDVVALAQTGTGKTAAFGLPILQMLEQGNRSPQALVLAPTRELCVQIARDMESYAVHLPTVHTVAIYGGASIQPQLASLARGVQIIVATPGRMLDVLRRGKADLTGVKRVILDEADEMLNMGFQEELEAILSQVPDTANTLLFSATMPRQVATIASRYMNAPEEITVGQRNAGAENVTHQCYMVHERDRYRALKRIADFYPDMYAIVFCRTRRDTQNVADWLVRDGYNVDALHGDLTQMQRDRVMQKFRDRSLQVLVATDVAARGLDVTDLTHVVNYNLPDDLSGYTHRSGRTGRAGKSGVSVVIINMREKGKIRRIEQMIGKTFTWRDVPSGQEVCRAQLLSLVERVKQIDLAESQIEPFVRDILTSLDGMDRDEIIRRFVSLQFVDLLEYYRGAEDLNPRQKSQRPAGRNSPPRETKAGRRKRDRIVPGPHAPGAMRMYINLGQFDGLTPARLMGMVNRTGGRNTPVGRIDIQHKHSFFAVAKADAEAIARGLSSIDVNGRPIRVRPADVSRRDQRFGRGRPRTSGKSAATRSAKRPYPPSAKGRPVGKPRKNKKKRS